MKFKRFMPETTPAAVTMDAFYNGTLGDRDLSVYAGLDDDGFEEKRQAILDNFELKRMAEEGGTWPDGRPMDAYVKNYADSEVLDRSSFYRVLDDDDNLVGYYMIKRFGPREGILSKSFVYADESDSDDDERVMFTLLNRMSESYREFNRVLAETGDYARAFDMMKAIEFDQGAARFAAGGPRPKKAGYCVKGSELDMFLVNDENKNKPVIDCPDGMKLE